MKKPKTITQNVVCNLILPLQKKLGRNNPLKLKIKAKRLRGRTGFGAKRPRFLYLHATFKDCFEGYETSDNIVYM